VSDVTVDLPPTGMWGQYRIDLADLLANGNSIVAGSADLESVVNVFVIEPSAAMDVSFDNIRFQLIEPISASQVDDGIMFVVSNTSPATVHYSLNGADTVNVELSTQNTEGSYVLTDLNDKDRITYTMTYWDQNAGEDVLSSLSVIIYDLPDSDSDGDGVNDTFDDCADTPAGTVVDIQGCEIDSASYTQNIPGKVEVEMFMLGGEGVAYHDVDNANNGNNGVDDYLINEGVDVSSTIPYWDDSEFNLVTQVVDQLYVGWTSPGEWINYSVDIAQAGLYNVSIMYSANGDFGTNGISLDIDGVDVTGGTVEMPSTSDPLDEERNWHHWNKVENVVQVELSAGVHVLTLRTTESGNMNYDYLEFSLVDE
jgi:hypothetical protein